VSGYPQTECQLSDADDARTTGSVEALAVGRAIQKVMNEHKPW